MIKKIAMASAISTLFLMGCTEDAWLSEQEVTKGEEEITQEKQSDVSEEVERIKKENKEAREEAEEEESVQEFLEKAKETANKKEQDSEQKKKDDFLKKIFYNDYSPKYYDDLTDKLLSYARKQPKNFIALDEVGGDLKFKKASFDDATIVLYKAFKHSGVSDIQIYVDRLGFDLNEYEVLELAYYYLDRPGLRDNIVLSNSYILKAEEKNDYKILEYSLKEEIEEFQRSTIYIIIEEKGEEIISLRISNDLPRWMFSYKRNGYKSIDWTPDIDI